MLGVVFCAIELLRKTYKMLGTHLTSSFDIPFGNFWTKKVEIFVTLKIYSVWNPDTLRSDTRKTSDTLKKLTRGFGPFFILHFDCLYGSYLWLEFQTKISQKIKNNIFSILLLKNRQIIS